MGLFEELNSLQSGQLRIDRDERHLLTLTSQPLEGFDSSLRRIGCQHLIVRGKPPEQCRFNRLARRLVWVDDEQHRQAERAPVGWLSMLCHYSFTPNSRSRPARPAPLTQNQIPGTESRVRRRGRDGCFPLCGNRVAPPRRGRKRQECPWLSPRRTSSPPDSAARLCLPIPGTRSSARECC